MRCGVGFYFKVLMSIFGVPELASYLSLIFV